MFAKCILTCLLFLPVILSKPVFALNTIEPFVHKTNYFSIESGLDEPAGSNGLKLLGTAIIGRGITPFFSGYMGFQINANRYFGNGSSGAFLGSIVSLYSKNHISLDATLETGLINDYFYLSPGIEINFDFVYSSQHKMGFYINANEQFCGTDTSWYEDDPSTPDIDESDAKYAFVPEMEFKIGYYIGFSRRHQLHVRIDQGLRQNPLFGEHIYYFDSIRFGYNVLLSSALQLQTECNLKTKQKGRKNIFGFRVGIAAW